MRRDVFQAGLGVALLLAATGAGCRRTDSTSREDPQPAAEVPPVTAPPVRLLTDDLRRDLSQVWLLRDQLEERELTSDRWIPMDYAPHLWRRLNARLLDLDLRARGGMAFDKQAVGKVVREYVAGLQRVSRQQPVAEGTDVLRRLAQAELDAHSAEQAASRSSFQTRSPELNDVGRYVRGYLRALYRAVDQLRWHGQLSLLLPADDRQYVDLTKELGSLLDGLASCRDQLKMLEEQGLDGSGVSGLREAWQTVQNAQDSLTRLLNAEVQSATEKASQRPDNLRLESLLATPLIRADQRQSLWDVLENLAPSTPDDRLPADATRSLAPPRLTDQSQLREHLRLHLKLVTLSDPSVSADDNPLQQCLAILGGSTADTQLRSKLRVAGQWLGDFYASLPGKIGGAAGSDPARSERLLRLLDARDAMRLPERAGPESWSFPVLRVEVPKTEPQLTVAWHDTSPDLRLSRDWQRVEMAIATDPELKSVSIQVDYGNPRAIEIRRSGQSQALSPGTLSEVSLDANGLVAFDLRALEMGNGRTGDLPVRFTVQSGPWKQVLPLRCRLPQPNEVELRAECIRPRAPAVSRGLDGVRLRPFPNRSTTYQLYLVNRSDEPKELEVQLLAVRRPADAQFGLGRLLDVRGKPYLKAAGDPLATAQTVSLPADGQAHKLAFDPPPAAPKPDETAAPSAAPTPPEPIESASPPPEIEITHGMLCVIRNLKNPQEVWNRWIELSPRLPREYLTVRSNYSEDTGRITVQATRPDVDRDGQPDLVDLPEDSEGETDIRIVWGTRGQITARATNGRFSGSVPVDGSALELWARIPDPSEQQSVLIPLDVDGYPRALLHTLNTNRFDRGTDERPRRRHIRVNLLSLGDRRFVTSPSAPQPATKEDQPPPVYLEEGQAVAFPVPRLGESEPLSVHFEADVPFDAFGDPDGEQFDEIRIGWEGERPLTFHADRQVTIRLVNVEPSGQITLKTRVDDHTCSLATTGKKGRFILVAGGRVEQRELVPNRVEVRLDHLPPDVLYFQPRTTGVTKGKPIVVDLEVQDLSGIAEVKLGLTRQAQDELPPDATVVPYTGIPVDDRATLELSLSTEDDKLSPGTYWIQAELVDQVGYSRKTGSAGFDPQPVRIDPPRPVARPGDSPTAEPVKGTLQGHVVFGTLDYRPRDFKVQIKGTSRSTTTAGRGAFRFPDLPAGEYVLEATGSLQGKGKKGEVTVKLQKPADYAEEVVIPVQ